MLYLDNWGKTQTWPFNPDEPDSQSEWKIVPWNEAESTYFVVSGEESRYANEMIYISDFGTFDTWATDTEDARATFVFLPAPPSPPLDFEAAASRGRCRVPERLPDRRQAPSPRIRRCWGCGRARHCPFSSSHP